MIKIESENFCSKETVCILKQQLEDIDFSLNNLEQYLKRVYIKINGIPYNNEESTDDIVVALAKKIDVHNI